MTVGGRGGVAPAAVSAVATQGGTKSRVVFVGNIPYDMTEEQLVDIFKEVGPVISFRLMFDRETGKARGFGFCEYADVETAASAIRNLNGYDVGGRTLKVDTADQDIGEAYRTPVSAIGATMSGAMGGGSSIPKIPISTPSIETINATLASLSNAQLLDLITQIKTMAVANPEQTRQLLNGNPSLTFSIFQAMVMMNLVDATTVNQIMEMSPMQQQSGGTAVPPSSSLSPAPGAPSSTLGAGAPSLVPGMPAAAMSPEQQRALIMQIMNLTPEQINALPPAQREQVLQVRAQLAATNQAHHAR